MMPGLPGYNASARAPSFDPAEAKKLLSESKYGGAGGLPTITFSEIGSGASQGLDTQVMVEQWKENLGVTVNIAHPDPEDIIDLLFHSTSRQNNTGYSNSEVDRIVTEARTERDVTKRIQLYQQAEQIILNDAAWIPLYFGKDHYVVKPYVKGFDPLPITIPRLRYVKIEK
jgi:oligopeptide transport system substrate-binding protein